MDSDGAICNDNLRNTRDQHEPCSRFPFQRIPFVYFFSHASPPPGAPLRWRDAGRTAGDQSASREPGQRRKRGVGMARAAAAAAARYGRGLRSQVRSTEDVVIRKATTRATMIGGLQSGTPAGVRLYGPAGGGERGGQLANTVHGSGAHHKRSRHRVHDGGVEPRGCART